MVRSRELRRWSCGFPPNGAGWASRQPPQAAQIIEKVFFRCWVKRLAESARSLCI
jgi:hypothetical protein